MRTDELDFELPAELIAQEPSRERAGSRLLHYRCADGSVAHRVFSDLPALLRAGDLLVFNDARVIAARFMLRKDTGGLVEGLFLAEESPGIWRVLLRNAGRVRPESVMHLAGAEEVAVRILAKERETYRIQVQSDEPATALLARIGRMPLPPYIHRGREHDPRDAEDRERYQTVYARAAGSVAAPTAGLHFTQQLLAELEARGIERATVTLDVGMGTFRPITCDTAEGHAMHAERYEVSAEAAGRLSGARREGRRIVAVGTTSARVLESQEEGAPFEARSGWTDIFVRPPYRWKHVGALVTNFHLPRSTLIALVAAMMGLEEQRRVYQAAIAERYRFFSYGDAMLIE